MSVIGRIRKITAERGHFCTAVILAAGSSSRMGKDKILMPIGDAPAIAYTLRAFQNAECVDEIVVVTRHESLQELADICHSYGITKTRRVVEGGSTRAQSSLCGVCSVSEEADIIAIHDGARPFVTPKLIERCVCAMDSSLAVTPAVSSTDTVRIVNKRGIVTETPERSTVALIQTPQVFHADIIKGALTKAVEKNTPITDDCSAVEALGVKVTVVDGETDNIKLTTQRDVYVAERILADRGALL